MNKNALKDFISKSGRSVLSTVLVLILVFSMTACLGIENYPDFSENDPGESATDNTLMSQTPGDDVSDPDNSTSIDQIGNNAFYELLADAYKSATKDGYDGGFDEYLKDILSVDSENDALNMSAGLLASVAIVATHEVRQTIFPFGTTTGKVGSSGSGVIYKLDKDAGDAYIITNYHVVHHDSSTSEDKISDDIQVYIYGRVVSGCEIKATFVGGSYNYDIAVLKIEDSDVLRSSDAIAIKAANSNDIMVGDKAIAIGNAEGMGISATSGVISVDSEYIELGIVSGHITEHRVIRIDTAVNSGNSGGGLFNASGELVGIVNAKTSDTSIEGIGYAIPSNIAIGVAQNIIDNYESGKQASLVKCSLGVTVNAFDHKAIFNSESGTVELYERVKVASVNDGAMAKGKLFENDIIKSITVGGKTIEVTRMFQVIDAMLWARSGEKIAVTVERNGEDLDVVFDVTDENMVKFD